MRNTYKAPKLMEMFTVVLTPKPFKTVLNGRPSRLHSLGLNKGSKWLSHLKWRAPALSHFNFFLAITLLTIEFLFIFYVIQV